MAKQSSGGGSGKGNTHHVTPNKGGGWDVQRGGSQKASHNFNTKAEATSKAREISRNQGTELKIHNMDGRISQSDSHGNDPCPPRG